MYNVVCSHSFREIISKHPQYVMDLGRKYSKRVGKDLEVDIKDLFVINFNKKWGELVYKIGRMGVINFYTFSDIPAEKVWVFKDDSIEANVYDFYPVEMELDVNKYLAKILMNSK